MITISDNIILSNLMIAYKRGDLTTYKKCLDKLQGKIPEDLFAFFDNFSHNSLFLRKGLLK